MAWSVIARLLGRAALLRLAAAALGLGLLPAGAPAAAESICVEAEHANDLTWPCVLEAREGASGGLAVAVPDGAGDSLARRGLGGTASYRVPVRTAGTYQLWLRVWWTDGCGNSVFAQAGDAPPVQAADEVFRRWHWVPAGSWTLAAGTAELRLRNREDGVSIDQLLLTTGGFDAREGAPREASLIPVGDARDDWRVLSGPAPEGERPAPEELMPRHLAPPDTVSLEGSRLLVLHGQEPSTLEVWVRNNSLRELSGRVTLAAPDGAGVGPAAAQEFRISAGQPLGKVTFKISAGAGLPRGRHELKLRAAGSDGRTREQRLILLRPLAWLVSSRLSLHGDGSGRPHAAAGAVESAPGGAFPGNVKGLTWTALREDCVTPFGLVDMRAAAGDAEDVMAYAYTEVTSPRETACLLEVMHDDMIRVWLNGRQVFREDYELIPATLTRKLVKVKLPAGRSRVLVKTGQRREHWEFAVGFLEEKGSDTLAVKVSDTFSSPVRGEETAGLSR